MEDEALQVRGGDRVKGGDDGVRGAVLTLSR